MGACSHCQLDLLAGEDVCPRCGHVLSSRTPAVADPLAIDLDDALLPPARGAASSSGRFAAPTPLSSERSSARRITAHTPVSVWEDAAAWGSDTPAPIDVQAVARESLSDIAIPELAPAPPAARSARAEPPVRPAAAPPAASPPAVVTEVPDLLPTAPARPAARPAAAPAASPPARPRSSPPPVNVPGGPGPDFDDDDAGPALSLEVVDTRKGSRSNRPPAAAAEAGAPRKGPVSVPPPAPRKASLPSLADANDDLDPYTIKRLADFGAAPTAPWEAPLYAARVAWRMGDLRRQTSAAAAAEVKARHALDDALVGFLDAARDDLLRDPTTARMLEPMGDLQRRHDEWGRSMAEAEARLAASLEQIDLELQRCERVVVAERSSRDGLSDEAARLYEASRGGDALAGQMLTAIRGQMAAAEQEATAAIARRTELLRERRAVEQEHDHATRELREGLAEADAPRRERLLEIGRLALESHAFDGHRAFGPVEAAQRAARDAQLARRLHEAALASYDRAQVTRGAVTLAALVVLLVVGVVLGVMRMNRELSAPVPVVPTVQ